MENLEEKNKNHSEVEDYGEKEDKRREIIDKFINSFKEKDDIHNAIVKGSFAKGVEDEYSDIDLSVAVDKEKEQAIIEEFEDFLSQFGEIDKRIGVRRKSGPKQIVYHIEGMSKYHTIDFVIEDYNKGEQIFETENQDEQKIEEKDFEYARKMLEHNSMLVEKEIKRGDLVYAGRLYIQYIFDSIVSLARGKYTPDKAEKGTRNLKKDLEERGFEGLSEEIENIWLSSPSAKEIEEKLDEAKSLYEKIIEG